MNFKNFSQIFLLATLTLTTVSSAALELGFSCNSNADCSSTPGLKCKTGKCVCDETTTTYNANLTQCVGLAGKPCVNDMCDEHMTCSDLCDNADPKTGKKLEKEICWKECLCPVGLGFVVTPEGKCTCGKDTIYSEKDKQCVGLVHKPCIHDLCTESAECMDLCDNSDQVTYQTLDEEICWRQCICPFGDQYSSTAEGLCQVNIGSACNSSSVCVSNSQCLEGVCGCGSDNRTAIWDSARQLCVGMISKPCVDDLHCVQNAQCYDLCDNFDPKTNKTTDEDICFKHCHCPGEVYAEPEIDLVQDKILGRCRAHFEGPCGNSNENCIEGLSCVEGQCQCPFGEHQVYDNTTKKCISLSRGPCDPTLPNPNDACTLFAHCSPFHKNKTSLGQCMCSGDYYEDKNGRCHEILEFGEDCPKHSSICDPRPNLKCIDGKCACANNLLRFNQEKKECEGLVGSSCGALEGISTKCIAGAECTQVQKRATRYSSDASQIATGQCTCPNPDKTLINRTCPAVIFTEIHL